MILFLSWYVSLIRYHLIGHLITEYQFSYNKSYPFDGNDFRRLEQLPIDIYDLSPDWPDLPYMLRCNALTYPLPYKSSHRLLLDCDMIALKNPSFDLSKDWQAMYAGSVLPAKYYEYINKSYGYNLALNDTFQGPLFLEYMAGKPFSNFFPHFNGGAFLIKEEFCAAFKSLTTPSYAISFDESVPLLVRHIGVQYGASFALCKMSRDWAPFEPGFNFLIGSMNPKDFGIPKISLIHYCGSRSFDLINQISPGLIDQYMH